MHVPYRFSDQAIFRHSAKTLIAKTSIFRFLHIRSYVSMIEFKSVAVH